MSRFIAVLLVLVLLPHSRAEGQVTHPLLRLDDAIQRARARAYANRGSRDMATAQHAAGLAAMRGILPSVRVDAGYVRTTDPIGAFGTTLRQRTIAQQDFDPARLNYPSPRPNYTAGLVLEQPLFNADAWAGRTVAGRAADAADATSRWTESGTTLDVLKAWFGSVVAREKASMLQSALRAAREHVRQAESMARNGLVTPADAMLASVKAGEVEVMLVEAEGEAATARFALATAMGTPDDTAFALPDELPPSDLVRQSARAALALGLRERDDVRAAQLTGDVAAADARRARSAYLPRVNSFARYDWNSRLRPFGGDENWTVGVMASWSPFAGASEIADMRATAARASAAGAMRDGAMARAQLEVVQNARALEVALARLDIGERMVKQSADAHRIVARKYEGGVAAVTELLDAAASETRSTLSLAGARFALLVASAERHRLLGHDPASLASLDTSTLRTAAPLP